MYGGFHVAGRLGWESCAHAQVELKVPRENPQLWIPCLINTCTSMWPLESIALICDFSNRFGLYNYRHRPSSGVKNDVLVSLITL